MVLFHFHYHLARLAPRIGLVTHRCRLNAVVETSQIQGIILEMDIRKRQMMVLTVN